MLKERPTLGHNSQDYAARWAAIETSRLAKRWADPDYVKHVDTLRAALDAYVQTKRQEKPVEPSIIGGLEGTERRRVIDATLKLAFTRLPATSNKAIDALILHHVAVRSDNQFGRCLDGLQSIARAIGYSTRTVERQAPKLVRQGLLQQEQRTGCSSALWLPYPAFLLEWTGRYAVSDHFIIDAQIGPPRRRGRPPKQRMEDASNDDVGTHVPENPRQNSADHFASGTSENPRQPLADLYENPRQFDQKPPPTVGGQQKLYAEDINELDASSAKGTDGGWTSVGAHTSVGAIPLAGMAVQSPPPIAPRPHNAYATSAVPMLVSATHQAVPSAVGEAGFVPEERHFELFHQIAGRIRVAQLGPGTEEPRAIADTYLGMALTPHSGVPAEALAAALDGALLYANEITSAANERRPLWNGKVPERIGSLPVWLKSNIVTQLKRMATDKVGLEAELAALRENADRIGAAKADAEIAISNARAVGQKRNAEARAAQIPGSSAGGQPFKVVHRAKIFARDVQAILASCPEATEDDVRDALRLVEERDAPVKTRNGYADPLPEKAVIDRAIVYLRPIVLHRLYGKPETFIEGEVLASSDITALSARWVRQLIGSMEGLAHISKSDAVGAAEQMLGQGAVAILTRSFSANPATVADGFARVAFALADRFAAANLEKHGLEFYGARMIEQTRVDVEAFLCALNEAAGAPLGQVQSQIKEALAKQTGQDSQPSWLLGVSPSKQLPPLGNQHPSGGGGIPLWRRGI